MRIMKKLVFGVIFGILLLSVMFVIAEDIVCSSDAECGEVTTTFPRCKNETHLCSTTRAPTCNNATTNTSECEILEEETCWVCDGQCEINTCVEVVCDSDHLNLCTGQNECGNAGGYWYNSTCNDATGEDCPQYISPAPNYCENGTLVGGELDENGCQPPGCEDDGDNGQNVSFQNRSTKTLKKRIRDYLGTDECPENCVCRGSTIKCETEEGREMTVVAGKSGNIIIQTKGVNASTKVILIRQADGIYGNFSGKLKKIKYTPEQIREIVLKRLKMRNCSEGDCEIILNEDGNYELKTELKYRFLFFLPAKKVVVTKVDVESGEIVGINRPWWRIISWRVKG